MLCKSVAKPRETFPVDSKRTGHLPSPCLALSWFCLLRYPHQLQHHFMEGDLSRTLTSASSKFLVLLDFQVSQNFCSGLEVKREDGLKSALWNSRRSQSFWSIQREGCDMQGLARDVTALILQHPEWGDEAMTRTEQVLLIGKVIPVPN